MVEQLHRIKRQIIELHVADEVQARQLQEQMSQIYRWRVVPLIEQICSELSAPHQLHQLDRVEIDLGALDPENLEQSIMAKLEPLLRQALAAQIGAQTTAEERDDGLSLGPAMEQAQLTLLASFLRTGTVPWWADSRDPALLVNCIEHLLTTAKASLRQTLPRWLRPRDMRRRLVLHIDNALLGRLAVLLRPDLATFVTSQLPVLFQLLYRTEGLRGRGRRPLQQLVWESLLEVMSDPTALRSGSSDALYGALLVRLAAKGNLPAITLWRRLTHLAGEAPESGALAQVRDALAVFVADEAIAPSIASAESTTVEPETGAITPAGFWRGLHDLARLMPISLRAGWVQMLAHWQAADPTAQQAMTIESLLAGLREALSSPAEVGRQRESGVDAEIDAEGDKGAPPLLTADVRARRAAIRRLLAQAVSVGWPASAVGELNQLLTRLLRALEPESFPTPEPEAAPEVDAAPRPLDGAVDEAVVDLWRELRDVARLMPASMRAGWVQMLAHWQAADPTAQRAMTIESLLAGLREALSSPAEVGRQRESGVDAEIDAEGDKGAPPLLTADVRALRTTILRLLAQAVSVGWPASAVGELNQLLSSVADVAEPDHVLRRPELWSAERFGTEPLDTTSALPLGTDIRSTQEQDSVDNRVDNNVEQEEIDDIDIDFDQIEELYIHNAGLVILWPFLGRFFEILSLIEDGQFIDPAAQQRAIGLLHYLATDDAPAGEYQAPLNKVLCGLPLTAVFDFGPPLSAAEVEACENLLTAVIVQVPILGEMSLDGLRRTFLQRDGILRSRDGAWLLQVARETYDVVLDRFPWSWQWINLPWMETPIQVEW